jgi:hypothetical protein
MHATIPRQFHFICLIELRVWAYGRSCNLQMKVMERLHCRGAPQKSNTTPIWVPIVWAGLWRKVGQAFPGKLANIWKHTRIQFCKYIGYVTYINIIFAKMLYNMLWVSHPTRLRIYRLFDLSQLHGTVDLLQDVAPQAHATAGLFHWRHEHLQRPGIQQKWCDNPLAQDWNDPHLPTLPLLLGEVCCLQVAYRHCLVAPAASNLQIQKKRRSS